MAAFPVERNQESTEHGWIFAFSSYKAGFLLRLFGGILSARRSEWPCVLPNLSESLAGKELPQAPFPAE